ncbi:type II secretion system protein GspL [Wenzhouxiangella sp. EGI_FJ10409]|uniref:type II secretion system protein GspL n=1 Tax=Wenzhouxiangella sp. EGI_FJ10409 TaxID=3243767 RepID=UPI0035D8F228
MARARSESLVVHAAGPQWSWALLDRAGGVADQGRCDPAEPDWPGEASAVVLVDASRCLGLSLELPPLRGQKLQQAMRWAAEEHLAGSAEDEHVVAGPRDAAGRLRCVSIANDVMAELTAPLDGLAAERMLPDALCLPWQAGRVSLAEHDGRILVRWDEWSFTSFDADLAADMIDSAAPPEAGWDWYGGDRPEWVERRGADDCSDGQPLLAILSRQAANLELNLLSGPWAPRSAATAQSQWRWAAIFAAVAVVMVIAYAALERYQLAQRSAALETAIEQQFRQAFPEVGRMVRPQTQAERELARLRFGQAAGLLDLMHRVAPVIDGQEQLQVERLDYRDGVLELGLRAPDVAALEQLEQRLRALDLSADVQTASLDDEGASGRIRINRGGGA